jgi:hypothetical protein
MVTCSLLSKIPDQWLQMQIASMKLTTDDASSSPKDPIDKSSFMDIAIQQTNRQQTAKQLNGRNR